MRLFKKDKCLNHIVTVDISLVPPDKNGVVNFNVKTNCNKSWTIIYPPFEDDIQQIVEEFTEKIVEEIKHVCNHN